MVVASIQQPYILSRASCFITKNCQYTSLLELAFEWFVVLCRELGNTRQANYCLSKAIIAEPEDIELRDHRASLYVELGEYQKAAESYEQISRLRPDEIEYLKKATQV